MGLQHSWKFLGEFNNGKFLKCSLLLAVLPRNRLDFIHLCIYLNIHISIYLNIHLSVYLDIHYLSFTYSKTLPYTTKNCFGQTIYNAHRYNCTHINIWIFFLKIMITLLEHWLGRRRHLNVRVYKSWYLKIMKIILKATNHFRWFYLLLMTFFLLLLLFP